MKIIKRLLILVLVLVTAAYTATRIQRRTSEKNEGPSISCPSDTLEMSVRDPESVLLAGVTAYDSQDGDLTKEILLGGISKLITKDTAKVTYLVFDSHNNMASFVRYIRYTDYQKPRFVISAPLVYSTTESIEILPRLSATDVLDGDISKNIRVTTLESTSNSELYDITVQVTNSLGDTTQLRLPLYMLTNNPLRPSIRLTSYLEYLDVGTDFDPTMYLTSLTVADTSIPLSEVQIDNQVNTAEPGTYYVTYSYSNGTNAGSAILTVVVQ